MRVYACMYIMCQERTPCMYSLCQEQTHLMSLLVLASVLNLSPLKTQELTIKLRGSLSLPLALKLFLKSF